MLQSTAGSLQSLCWASSAVGGIASAYFSGALVEAYGPRAVFGLTAVFPLLVSVSAVFIAEQPIVNARHKRSEPDADDAEMGRSRWSLQFCIFICMRNVLVQFSHAARSSYEQPAVFAKQRCSKCDAGLGKHWCLSAVRCLHVLSLTRWRPCSNLMLSLNVVYW